MGLHAPLRYSDPVRTMHIAWLTNAALEEKLQPFTHPFVLPSSCLEFQLCSNVQKEARFGGSDTTPPSAKL